jgi:hypothetical protein
MDHRVKPGGDEMICFVKTRTLSRRENNVARVLRRAADCAAPIPRRETTGAAKPAPLKFAPRITIKEGGCWDFCREQ